ncbi:MAG: aminopeptidase [Candidatus Saganbacteria bacterium]|nr:aminopeptidase [Candidatus Saganbacteria bacterium]
MVIGAVSMGLSAPVLGVVGTEGEGGSCNGENLVSGAQNYLENMLGLKAAERVFIIYDQENAEIARAFEKAARASGAQVVAYDIGSNRFSPEGLAAILRQATPQADLFISDEEYNALEKKLEPEGTLPPLFSNYDLFLNFVTSKPEETPGRVRVLMTQYILGVATETVRTGHAPGITREMVCFRPNFAQMDSNSKKLVELLKDAKTIKVTTAKGMDLTMDVTERGPVVDVLLGPGTIGNVPSGELFLAPVETGANGVIVVDGSIGLGLGLVPSPIKIVMENGKVVSVAWQDESYENADYLARFNEVLEYDEEASVIGEFGIGLAAFPVVGILLQDEKSEGTIHIAFGKNSGDTPGGQNRSGQHIDCIITAPKVVISYTEESGKAPIMVMENGIFLLD